MCRYRSGIAVRHGDDIELLTLSNDDSHTNIRIHHGVPEDTGGIAGRNDTPVEFVPYGALDSFKDYKLIYNASKPDWVTGTMDAKLRQYFKQVIQQDITANQITRRESLDLNRLTSLPADVRITVGSYVDLRCLISLPADAQIEAGGTLYLTHLHSLPANVRIKAGGTLYLNHLTSLPADAQIEAGGTLYLNHLTSLPADAQVEALHIQLNRRSFHVTPTKEQ